jgi:hypothetical protein
MSCCSNLNYFPLPCGASDDREETIKKISISKHDYFEQYGKSLSVLLDNVKNDANLSITLTPLEKKRLSDRFDVLGKFTHECTIKTSNFKDVVFNIAISL